MRSEPYRPGPRRQLVLDSLERGESVKNIAFNLRITEQRVRQHRDALRKRGLLPERQEVSA